MHFLYNIGIYLYGFAIMVASLFTSKARKRYKGSIQTFADLKNKIDPADRYVWIHAASLGEFEQGRPLIEQLKRERPEYKILLTFYSPSGYEIRKNYSNADVVCYLPLDTRINAHRFFHFVKPERIIFIKYEFWANFLMAGFRRHIPTYLISAIFRPRQRFFRSYGKFFLNLLKNYEMIFVQDEDSRKLLEKYGVNRVMVADDTRFDRVVEIAKKAKDLSVAKAFADNAQVLVAGSSWEPDEVLLSHYLDDSPDKKLILAPHVISPEHINAICGKLHCKYAIYTQTNETDVIGARCLIIDTMGILSSLYRYGQVAYIGGGFGVGIHNTLEAAVWKMPVVFGPNYKKFREAYELIKCGGGKSISNYAEMKSAVDGFFGDKSAAEKAGIYVEKHQGATKLIMQQIF